MIGREGIYDSFIREMNSQDYGGTKPHSRPSISWRPGDVGTMAKSTSKTLRIRKVNGVILRWILKAREAGWGWGSTGISPGVPGPDSLEFWCSRAEEEKHPSSRREKPFLSNFVLPRSPVDLMVFGGQIFHTQFDNSHASALWNTLTTTPRNNALPIL